MPCPLINAFRDVRPWISEDVEKLRIQLDPVFFFVPRDVREGPWAISSIVFVVGAGGLVLASAPYAATKISPLPEPRSDVIGDVVMARFASGIFGLGVLWHMWRRLGWWPVMSWTMLGWEVANLRYLCGAFGFQTLQRVLTFPSLLVNIITVVVWHVAMVPAMAFLLTQSTGQRTKILPFICSPLLLTVHVFNMPWAYIDWYVQPVKLTFFDLWLGIAFSLSYLAFYLLVLENIGCHWYFILSPRKWWGSTVYSTILLLVFGIWSLCCHLGPAG